VVALGVVTAAIGLGLVIMYLLQVSSAHRTIDDQLRTYAVQISQTGGAGTWPRPLPASSVDPDAVARVLAPDGTVLAASRPLRGEQTGEIQTRATVAGQRVDTLSETRLARYRRRQVGMIFQFFNLLGDLTVADNVLLPAQLARTPRRQARARCSRSGV